MFLWYNVICCCPRLKCVCHAVCAVDAVPCAGLFSVISFKIMLKKKIYLFFFIYSGNQFFFLHQHTYASYIPIYIPFHFNKNAKKWWHTKQNKNKNKTKNQRDTPSASHSSSFFCLFYFPRLQRTEKQKAESTYQPK